MPGRAWTPEEKIQIVLESMNTNISLAELCRKYNLSPGVFYQWKEKFIKGGKLALSGSAQGPGQGEGGGDQPAQETDRRAHDRERGDEGGPAGGGEKMTVAIMMHRGLSLRKALSSVGSSQGAVLLQAESLRGATRAGSATRRCSRPSRSWR